MARVLLVLFISLFGFCCCTDYTPTLYSTTGHYYQLIIPSTPMTMTQAMNYANSKHLVDKQGYLVTVNDQLEQNYLNTNYFTKTYSGYPAGTQYLQSWTGGKRNATSGAWINYALSRASAIYYDTTTKTCNGWCNWATGEPAVATNLCMQVYCAGASGGAAGQWFASDCSAAISSLFVIEYDQPSSSCSAGYTYTSTPYPQCTLNPTGAPTGPPTSAPTAVPTGAPTAAPTSPPTSAPTAIPTGIPTSPPTIVPTGAPTSAPTSAPTGAPTGAPTSAPTGACTGTPPAGSWSAIQALGGLVLDLQNGATAPGTNLVVNNLTWTDSQLWRMTPEGYILNKCTGFVMDIANEKLESGNPVIVWYQKPLEQSSNQLWTYEDDGAITSQANNELTIDVYQGFARPQQPIIIYWVKTTAQGNDNQLYTFVPQPDR